MFSPLVGLRTVCERPRSLIKSNNNWFIEEEYWWPIILFCSQSMSGRLKSPHNQKIDFGNLDLISEISSQIS